LFAASCNISFAIDNCVIGDRLKNALPNTGMDLVFVGVAAVARGARMSLGYPRNTRLLLLLGDMGQDSLQ